MALTRENTKSDPTIWKRLDRGEFRLVYASPEILLRKKSHFMRRTVVENNTFKENLTCIAMDEAHAVWQNGEFRGAYNKVGRFRDFFPNVPIVALSATFPPHVVSLVHKVLNMQDPSDVITCNGRRKNINLLVAEQPSRTMIQPLLGLIPRKIKSIDNIEKTLIFVDSVAEARHIAIKLRKKLMKVLPSSNPKNTIRTYYSSTDELMKQSTISLIKNGEARLTVCTDSMSLGVDIRDIMRVIQWGVNDKLNLDILVQRFGRVARDPSLQGVGVIYAPKDILNPIPKYTMEQWITQPDEFGRILDEVNGTDDDEWEDLDFIIPSYRNRDLSLFSLPVTQETERQVVKFRRHMYQRAKNAKNLRQEAAAERKPRNARRGTEVRRTKRKSVETIDPALLWFLNTSGCRHRCILNYLQYPDVFDDSAQESWCCDRCAISRKMDPETTVTAGISITDSYFWVPDGASAAKLKPTTAPATPLRNVNAVQLSPILCQDLKLWRNTLWAKLVTRQAIWSGCPDEIVLPDIVIKKIVNAIRKIHTVSDVVLVLGKARFDVKASLLREKDIQEIFNIFEHRITEHVASGTLLIPLTMLMIVARTIPGRHAFSVCHNATESIPASMSMAPFFPRPPETSTWTASMAPIFPCPPARAQLSSAVPATLVHPSEIQLATSEVPGNASETPVLASRTPIEQQPVTSKIGTSQSNKQTNKRDATFASPLCKRRKPFADITNRGPPLCRMDDTPPTIEVTANSNSGQRHTERLNKTNRGSSKVSPNKQRRNAYFDIATISNEIRGADKREIKPSRRVEEAKESMKGLIRKA